MQPTYEALALKYEYSGKDKEARRPMITTTTNNSKSVLPLDLGEGNITKKGLPLSRSPKKLKD